VSAISDIVHRVLRRPISRLFHRIYYAEGDRTWQDTRWLGARVYKTPLDLWVYQEIVVELRPDLIVETGTYAGGTAHFLATVLDHLGNGRVLTIDVKPQPSPLQHDRITYLTGSSTDPAVADVVREASARSATTMVILDSAHDEPHVLAEMELYEAFVTPGSYLIVEDTNLNGHPVARGTGRGPMEAVDRFLSSHPRFEVDRSRERFLLTFNPRGFLRRLP
jgi:cephalosporin hydroxylase